MVGDRSPIGVRQAEAKDDRRLLVVDCNRSAITLERLTDTERRTLTIVIAPPKYSSGELNMDAPKY